MICNVVACKNAVVKACACGHQVCQIHSDETAAKDGIAAAVCVECARLYPRKSA